MDPKDLEIDILSDSVNDILDKLFYSATDGKVIDYAWDAPQPASINPLSDVEASEWGKSAMNVTFSRVSATPQRLGKRKVSALKRFAQRGTAKPYYGYKSEPPKCRATAAEEPVGPLAKAIRAAGTLSALSKHKGEDESFVWELLEGTWGAIPDVVKLNAEPDVTRTSRKDEIKFARSPSHMIFGFNSDAPTVSVSMGNYLSHHLDKPYMFDWHAMAVSMRFIGEFVSRYNLKKFNPGDAISFSPVAQEARLLSSVEYRVNLPAKKAKSADTVLAKLTAKTFQEFTVGVASVVTRNNIASSNRSIKMDLGTEATDKLQMAIVASMEPRRNRLPKNILSTKPVPQSNDISAGLGGKFRKSVLASASKISENWIPTWKSVHSIVWQMYFETGFKGDAELTAKLREKRSIDELDSNELAKYTRAIASVIPKTFGFTVYLVLSNMLGDKEAATLEFIKMTREISGSEKMMLEDCHSSAYIRAVAMSVSLDSVTKYLNLAYSGYGSRTHGKTKLTGLLRTYEGNTDGIKKAFAEFMNDRSSYWASFYASRALEVRDYLKALKVLAKSCSKGGFTGLGKTFSTEGAMAIMNKDHSVNSEEELKALISELKITMITYTFVASAYRDSMVEIDDGFNAKVKITPERLAKLIVHSADNYVRKRQTWGRKFSVDESEWEDVKKTVLRCTRVKDITTTVDAFLQPIVSWTECYSVVELKFLKSSRSISNMLRAMTARNDLGENSAEKEEEIAMVHNDAAIVKRFASKNSYAGLFDFSDSDETESDSESKHDTKDATKYKEQASKLHQEIESSDDEDSWSKVEVPDAEVDTFDDLADIDEIMKPAASSPDKSMSLGFDMSSFGSSLFAVESKPTIKGLPTLAILKTATPSGKSTHMAADYIFEVLKAVDIESHRTNMEDIESVKRDYYKYLVQNSEQSTIPDVPSEDNVDIG